MSFLLDFLPIVIYVLLIIVLIIGIVLAIKCLIALDKVEKVVDNVNEKVRALDGLFHIIDTTTDKIVLVTDKVVELLLQLRTYSHQKRKAKKKLLKRM